MRLGSFLTKIFNAFDLVWFHNPLVSSEFGNLTTFYQVRFADPHYVDIQVSPGTWLHLILHIAELFFSDDWQRNPNINNREIIWLLGNLTGQWPSPNIGFSVPSLLFSCLATFLQHFGNIWRETSDSHRVAGLTQQKDKENRKNQLTSLQRQLWGEFWLLFPSCIHFLVLWTEHV